MGTRIRLPGVLAGGHTLAQATAWDDGKDPMGEDGWTWSGLAGARGAFSYLYPLFIYGLFIVSFVLVLYIPFYLLLLLFFLYGVLMFSGVLIIMKVTKTRRFAACQGHDRLPPSFCPICA